MKGLKTLYESINTIAEFTGLVNVVCVLSSMFASGVQISGSLNKEKILSAALNAMVELSGEIHQVVFSNWILLTTRWRDEGIWEDEQTWND